MKCKAMDLYHGLQTKGHNKLIKPSKSDHDLSFHDHDDMHLVIIKLSNSWLLKLISRAIMLALFILSFPWLNMVMNGRLTSSSITLLPHEVINGGSNNNDVAAADLDHSINIQMLPLLFHDLTNEGLLKMGDRALFVSNENEEAIYNSDTIREYGMDVITISEFEQQSSLMIPDETFDFVFAHNYEEASTFINRSLKIGGIFVIQLNDNPMIAAFDKPSNYKIVYLRRFYTTIVAMKKISSLVGGGDTNYSSATQRRLLYVTTDNEAKRAALENLEDVLLEPPRTTSRNPSGCIYLPDLMGDSLESYPRRVFIDVGFHENIEDDDEDGWFFKYYPTKNKDFETYKVNTIIVDQYSSEKEVPQGGMMSDWLMDNVKEDEYVVMKAEAEVVEEMVKTRAIKLVDELFLECKHQGIKKRRNKSRRAYWECLALYGILRDEGIAVHQWWG